ncbi:hypothetical protein Slala03_81170 [Streptomyces lavendulae subsp. lavendulae]|uniref:hypothetical protein n=1 Tax=Streptomyces lavendulae TaxID=1914 RepID=UPI0024A4E929|nr:hypothetical protein [Streptomyces lavendulae]GLV88428.1 hypothetical protein Slala03_81170 [Streptomyces lavendulae subsp. lavendulae]
MTGPLTPDESGQPSSADAEQARDAVDKVIRLYGSRLAAAQHDPVQAASLRQARDQAFDDLERLEEASADETVQIAIAYAARLKELREN